jgi:hypothetical protein
MCSIEYSSCHKYDNFSNPALLKRLLRPTKYCCLTPSNPFSDACTKTSHTSTRTVFLRRNSIPWLLSDSSKNDSNPASAELTKNADALRSMSPIVNVYAQVVQHINYSNELIIENPCKFHSFLLLP